MWCAGVWFADETPGSDYAPPPGGDITPGPGGRRGALHSPHLTSLFSSDAADTSLLVDGIPPQGAIPERIV